MSLIIEIMVVMIEKTLWTQQFWSDKLDISLRPSKSTGQTQLDILPDVLHKFFSLPHGLFRGFYKLKPKLVSVTN